MRIIVDVMEQEHQKRETELSVLEAGIANKQQNIERVRREMDEQASRSGGVAGQIAAQKKRMEAADVLYGVTMQEQGISKILHINLGEMEQQLGITG